MPNVYEIIRLIKLRPGMYSPDRSLQDIELYLHGYDACLKLHMIDEIDEDKIFEPHQFTYWLYKTFGWSGSQGFANAIIENTGSSYEAFDRFFELVKQYKKSEKPINE